MNFTIIIIVLLIVFITSLILLNFSKIKKYFLSLKKSKKKKSKKNKKDKDSKNVKLQKSSAQTRPVVKPPEQKKIEQKKDNIENKSIVLTEQKDEYQQNVQPIVAPNVVQNNSAPPINSNFNNQNVFAGNKYNLMPKTKKEDLDKEFDEIRKFLDSSPQPKTAAQRPNFFNDSNINNSKPALQGQMYQTTGNLPYMVIKPQNDKFINNTNNNFNPYMANGFAPKQPLNNRKAVSSQDFINGFNNSFPQRDITTNSTMNAKLNIPGQNQFIPQNNNFIKATPNYNQNNMIPYANNFFNKPILEEQEEMMVKIDDDEIDLNKLSPNVKKLIISNILARRNYDD